MCVCSRAFFLVKRRENGAQNRKTSDTDLRRAEDGASPVDHHGVVLRDQTIRDGAVAHAVLAILECREMRQDNEGMRPRGGRQRNAITTAQKKKTSKYFLKKIKIEK